MIDVDPSPLVIGHTVEDVEVHVIWRFDGLLDQLNDISLTGPDRTRFGTMWMILGIHPADAQTEAGNIVYISRITCQRLSPHLRRRVETGGAWWPFVGHRVHFLASEIFKAAR